MNDLSPEQQEAIKDAPKGTFALMLLLAVLTAAGWDGSSFDVHWTENCGNDSILVDPPASVPTPSALVLLLVGFIGFKLSNKKQLAI